MSPSSKTRRGLSFFTSSLMMALRVSLTVSPAVLMPIRLASSLTKSDLVMSLLHVRRKTSLLPWAYIDAAVLFPMPAGPVTHTTLLSSWESLR